MQEKLTPKERDVLRLNLDLDDGIKRPSEEICQLFGVTKSEVEKFLNSAIQKINEEYINIMQILNEKSMVFGLQNLEKFVKKIVTKELQICYKFFIFSNFMKNIGLLS